MSRILRLNSTSYQQSFWLNWRGVFPTDLFLTKTPYDSSFPLDETEKDVKRGRFRCRAISTISRIAAFIDLVDIYSNEHKHSFRSFDISSLLIHSLSSSVTKEDQIDGEYQFYIIAMYCLALIRIHESINRSTKWKKM